VDPKTAAYLQALAILKRLGLFWKQAQVPNKWNIQVFNAVNSANAVYTCFQIHVQPGSTSAHRGYGSKIGHISVESILIDQMPTKNYIVTCEFCNGWRRRRNHLLIKWQFLKTNEENCQDTLSEDQETTYNTKQRLRQECSRHNKLNKEGWDAEEWRGNMKPWNIAGSEETNTHTQTHRLKCRTGSPRDKNWSLNGEAPSWKFSSPESIVSL